jgi:hypothetical protein
LAGRCGRRRPAAVRDLRGLAQKGAPPEFLENFWKNFGTKSGGTVLGKLCEGGPPNYFSPTGDRPVGVIEKTASKNIN